MQLNIKSWAQREDCVLYHWTITSIYDKKTVYKVSTMQHWTAIQWKEHRYVCVIMQQTQAADRERISHILPVALY